MVIVELRGGLGNQLFEYAAGRQVAAINRCQLKLDTVTGFGSDTLYRRKYALASFNVKAKLASRLDLDLARTPRGGYRTGRMLQLVRNRLPERLARHVPSWGSSVYTEDVHFVFDHRLLEPTTNHVLLRGHWQNSRYFGAVEGLLRKEFTLRRALSARAAEYRYAIGSTPSVAVHCRRTFATVPEAMTLHGCLGLDYYEQAIGLVKTVCNNASFFVFADDPKWAVEHVRLDGPTTYVTGNADYEDLFLMSQCKHQVIANSSFGWWAAWLNENPDKMVIAPQNYVADPNADLRDLYPAKWRKL